LFAANIVELDDVVGSAFRSEAAAALRVGVHGTATGMETLAPGDEDDITGGGGDEVRKMSAAAAMMGAVVLVLEHMLLLPSDTRRGCAPADKGWSDADWVGEDGGGCSSAARPRDLRRFDRFRSSALACSRAFSASLRARASEEIRGLVAVEVRAHSGTT
jgi:hypothetical protein